MVFLTQVRSVRLAAAAAALALLAGCGGGGTGTNGSTDGYVGPTGGITKVAQADREDAPTIEGVTLEGDDLTSADYAGKVMVVNVWGSWCAPCRKEAPALQEVSEQYTDKGVQFLGVNVRDNPAAALAFEKQFGVTYPSLDDSSQKSLLAFKDSLPAQGIPTTWIIDEQGKVAVRIFVDNLTASTLAGLIDDVIAGA